MLQRVVRVEMEILVGMGCFSVNTGLIDPSVFLVVFVSRNVMDLSLSSSTVNLMCWLIELRWE